MEKVKVIFRKNKCGDVVAFFPELKVNYGNVMSYMHIGQHSEASYKFYTETVKVSEEEYEPLLDELKGIYNDCILEVKQRINYNDLLVAWN